MMVFLFALMVISLGLVWVGKRSWAIGCFYLMFVLAVYWALHHMNDALKIAL